MLAQTVPDTPSSADAMPPARVVLFLVGYFAAISLAIAAYSRLAPGYLLQAVNPNVSAAAVFFGVLAFLWVGGRWVHGVVVRGATPPVQSVFAMIALAVLLGFKVPMFVATTGVQIVAFAGLTPVSQPTLLTVTGTHWDWWAKRSAKAEYIDVQSPGSADTVSLPASEAAFQAVKPGDRLDLTVQTGRFGIRRVLIGGRVTAADLRAM